MQADKGLLPKGNYGSPGENTVSPVYPSVSFAEASLPPLQHYAVADAEPIVHAEPAAGTVLVDGDGFAVRRWSVPGSWTAGGPSAISAT